MYLVIRHNHSQAFHLRQPGCHLSEGYGAIFIYLVGRHRYDAVISRHNVVVVRHTEGSGVVSPSQGEISARTEG